MTTSSVVVPDSTLLAHVQQMCDVTSPYELRDDELFMKAMR